MEGGNLLPDEAEDGLIGGDGGEAEVPNIVVFSVTVSRGRDAEEPGDVAYRVVELGGGTFELCGGDDGEDALHEAVGAAFGDDEEGFVEGLLGVVDDAAGGAFIQVGAGASRLAEEGGELFCFGFQLCTFLFEGSSVVCRLYHMVCHLNWLCQYLFHDFSHCKRYPMNELSMLD